MPDLLSLEETAPEAIERILTLAERIRTQGRELAERQGAVARLKALNENIIESINSGLVTTDLNGRINFVNRGGTEILRETAERVDGRSIESVFRISPRRSIISFIISPR